VLVFRYALDRSLDGSVFHVSVEETDIGRNYEDWMGIGTVDVATT